MGANALTDAQAKIETRDDNVDDDINPPAANKPAFIGTPYEWKDPSTLPHRGETTQNWVAFEEDIDPQIMEWMRQAMAAREIIESDAPQPANDNLASDSAPVDLWQRRAHPPLPSGLLPPIIEGFARVQGELMGVDPGGLAAAALAVCAAAIPDSIKLRVKRHDPHWLESARLWVAPIGDPSTKKVTADQRRQRTTEALRQRLVPQIPRSAPKV